MILKEIKDQIIKKASGRNSANSEFRDFIEYFNTYGAINFKIENLKSEKIILARSTNFKYGAIVTSGRNPKELDENIKDAILTAFDIPSAYAKEANISRVGDSRSARYATA